MVRCPACGEENPERARFCLGCGTAVEPSAARAREVRKTVTVLFCDVTGSTALGEQLDPETMRSLMGRVFTEMRRLIERHGGTVEKFIGDAVMAVFGIPVLHEDDATRAVRAAADIRDALAVLNEELAQQPGVRILIRTGLMTGEVVAGVGTTAETLVTGDTVNTAARLQQAAAPGEILLGAPTFELVRDAVRAQALGPLTLRGKEASLGAYRLDAVSGSAGRARHLERPLVGREDELDRLDRAFRDAVRERRCESFTMLGTAGVGKSRLVAEFVRRVGDEAVVVRGRCLPYGDGITYWPIAEIVREAAGIAETDRGQEARARLVDLMAPDPEASAVAAGVAHAIGLADVGAPQEELFWAIRRLLEHIARERPLVAVIDDIHWAEPTLLDLIEYIADWSRGAPMLLLCPARPELLEARPTWGGGRLSATTVLLEPLGAVATDELIRTLPGGDALPDAVRRRIAEAAEGNPLYIEELIGMLRDDGRLRLGDAGWVSDGDLDRMTVPPTIAALLAARLDALPPDERAVAERASVVGRTFEGAAVAQLAPAGLRPRVPRTLQALVRKELVRPDRSGLSAADAFRFRHVLIRDAAYEALPKSERLELHERFADWLETAAGDRRSEFAEIVGHHLVQAVRYHVELGRTGERLDALRERGGRVLMDAGVRALDRGDQAAATALLTAAAGMYPEGSPPWFEPLVELVDVYVDNGELDAAEAVLARIALRPPRPGSAAAGHVDLARLWVAWLRDPHTYRDAAHAVDAALAGAATRDDPRWLAAAWRMRGTLYWMRLDAANAIRAYEAALDFDRTALNMRGQAVDMQCLGGAYLFGATPVPEAIEACEALLDIAADHPMLRAGVLVMIAVLHAMDGAFDAGHRVKEVSLALVGELPLGMFAASTGAQNFGIMALLEGDITAAIAILQDGLDRLTAMGEHNFASTTAALLGQARFENREYTEALRLQALAMELGADDDIATQCLARGVEGLALAALGRHAEAEAASADAVLRAEPAAGTTFHADTVFMRARVLALAGNDRGARLLAVEALDRYQHKGNRPMVARVTAFIADLEV